MRSMTGFGSATRSRAGLSVTVEVRSVNNRFLKLVVRAPSLLSAREHEIEALVKDRVARGSVTVMLRTTLAELGVTSDQARLLMGHSMGGDVSRGYITAPLLIESLRPLADAVAEKYSDLLGDIK